MLRSRVELLERFRELDTLKDALFVLVISALIWVLLRRYLREIREATLALRESEASTRLALEAAQMGSFDWDVKSGRITWSKWHEQHWGFKPGEYDGSYEMFMSRVHPEDRSAMEAEIHRSRDAHSSFQLEFRVVWPDGSLHWMQGMGEFRYDSESRPVRMYGTVMEITERRLTQQVLLESEMRRSLALSAAEMGTWEWELSSGNLTWSESTERMWGFRPKEFSGRMEDFTSRIHPDDLPHIWKEGEAAQREDRTAQVEFRVIRPDGSLRWVASKGRYLPGAVGQGTRMVGVVQDISARKRHEEQLREGQRNLRLAMTAAQMGTWEFDFANNRLQWSDEIFQVFGISPQEISRDFLASLIVAEDREIPEQAMQKAIATRTRYEAEYRVRINERTFWVDDRGEVEFDPNGQPRRAFGVAMDITQRKLVEQTLRDRESEFRAIFEVAAIGIIQTDLPTGRIVRVNRKYSDITGYTEAELLRMRIPEITHPEDRERDANLFQRLLQGEQADYQIDKRYLRKDGRVIWISVNRTVIRDEAGRPAHTLASIEDISQRRAAEEALRQREADFRAIFEVAAIGVAQTDPQTGRWVRVNRKFCEITGYAEPELLALRISEITHPADREQDAKLFQRVIRNEQPHYHLEKRYVRKDGAVIWVNVNMTVIRDSEGQPVRTIATIEDISQRHAAEDALRESLLFRREAEKIARVGAWKVSPATDYLYWTEGVYEILEAPLDYKPGLQEGLKFYDPAYIPKLQAALEQALNDGTPFSIETPLVTATGKRIWTEVRGIGRVVEAGEPFVMGTFQDITERKLAEQTMRESEERLRLALRSAAQGLYDLNIQTGETIVSAEYATMLGFDPQTFKETNAYWVERLHPEDRERVFGAYQDYLEGKSSTYSVEFRQRAATGDWKWILSNGSIVSRDEQGRPLRMLGTHTDITTLKNAERQAAQNVHRMELLLDLHQRSSQMSDKELYDYVLDKAVKLTDSAIGFFHQISDDQSTVILTTWNHEALKNCTAAFESHYPLRQAGNWVDCVRQQRAVIYNDFAHSPNQHGLPAGHAPLKRFMSIPVIQDGKVRIIFGVGNKVDDYNEDDVKQLQLVANELHKVMVHRAAQRQLSRLSLAVEQNSASIMITDTKGVIEYVNPRFEDTTGFSASDACGRTPRILKSGFTAAAHYEEMWRTVLAGKRWRGEFLNRRKNGELYWELTDITVLRDAQGAITNFVSIKEDITQRKRLEALRLAMLGLGDQLNQTDDAHNAGRALLAAADQLWQWDSAALHVLDARLGTANCLLSVDVIDGRRQELAADHDVAVTPRMKHVMRHGAQLILRKPSAVAQSDSTVFGDESRLSASIMSVPIRRESLVVGFFSIQSYTFNAFNEEDLKIMQALADYCGGALHRIRTDLALRTSEQRYRNLVETTFDWIWEVNAEGRYTYASPKVMDLLGYRPEEVLGRTPFDLMLPEEAARVGAQFREFASRRIAFSALQNVNRHKDGRFVVLESSGVPIVDGNGKFLGYRGMDRDVTERKKLEEQLRQTQKLEAIGQLAGGVAHDFNNMLAAILMQVSVLQSDPALSEEISQGLNEVDTAARRAAALTRQLLMFSRRSVLAVKPLDVNDVINSLLKMLGRLIGEHIDLRFEGKANLPKVEADAGMLDQVLMNLVVNARDAMPKGGRVMVSTSPATFDQQTALNYSERCVGDFVCLAVSDTGTGMDEATRKRIFEPFFTTKEAGKGTGLGLATVHGIVAQHKGWLEVESEPGVGSTFRVYLPAMAAAAETDEAEPEKPIQGGRETVLLVEDDAVVRRIVGQVMRLLGYTVHEASNGQEAMKLWQRVGNTVDLLFTDMVMPEGMTGLELTEQLQALRPGLRAIISSGYSNEITQAGVPTKAGITYLPKPYVTPTLAKTLRDALEARSPAEEPRA